MKKLPLILIVVGFLTVFYPFLEGMYVAYWQQKLLAEMEPVHRTQSSQAGVIIISVGEDDVFEEESGLTELSGGYKTVGILSIDKINLIVPILEGTSGGALRIGVGLLETTPYPGDIGNSVLTAHRSHGYGVKFNRLDELRTGDKVTIYRLGEVYEYTVSFAEIMETEEIYNYIVEGDEEMITLITCHPLYQVDPPFRIVVQAERVPQKDE